MLVKTFNKDALSVQVFSDREQMGEAVSSDIIKTIKRLLEKKDEVNIIFAAAPSQGDMLDGLVNAKDVEWNRVNAFHMDEYIGLDKNAPQRFGNFLDRHIFNKLPFKKVYYLNGENDSDIEKEIKRYTKLLADYPTDISLNGIGENGHLAFNDPHVADFDDQKDVKVVLLDEKCRQQQVNDKCFEKIEDVPKRALTLTIPAVMNAPYIFCTVPDIRKKNAVDMTINGEINAICPATYMRKVKGAKLYLDSDSGASFI
jgi:glucosamine-6-phosphate deaminase